MSDHPIDEEVDWHVEPFDEDIDQPRVPLHDEEGEEVSEEGEEDGS